MRSPRRLKIFFIGVVSVFAVAAALPATSLVHSSDLFPLYSWELGFGRIVTEDRYYRVDFLSINGEDLTEPVTAMALFNEKWRFTSDYKVAKEFVRQIKRSGTVNNKARKALENDFIRRLGFSRAVYRVREVTYNPLEFYHNKKASKSKVYGNFEYYESQD